MNEPERTTQELEQLRDYLQLLGRLQVRGQMQAKVDMSGVIQKTLLEAHQTRDAWHTLPEHRRLAWFREVFSNNLHDEVRRFRTQRRDVAKERPIHSAVEDSAARLNDWLQADLSSPSSRAVKQEDAVRLAAAVGELPDDQRTAVEMHYLQGLPLADVASQLNRSRAAAAMLVYRGITTLRRVLGETEAPGE